MTGKPITIEEKVSDQRTYEVEFRWVRHPLDRYTHITGECAVCNYPLEKKFPEDYPDEWKFCCACKELAEIITIGGDDARSPLAKKIWEKITLVKGK